MYRSDLALEKYWVTQSSYFRLATTVALGMGITDGKLLYCHSDVEGNFYKKISTLEYNNRMVYDCFNNPFTDEFGSPALNLPTITIDDWPRLHKRAQYTPYLPQAAIFVAYENSDSTLTTPSDSTDLLPSDDHHTLRDMNREVPFLGSVHREYCCRKHDKKDATKRQGFISPHAMIITIIFLLSWVFRDKFRHKYLPLRTSTFYVTIFQLIVVFVSLPYFTLPVEIFCACFIHVTLINPCNIPHVCSDWLFDIVLSLLTSWMHVMTYRSDRKDVLTIFMPKTGY